MKSTGGIVISLTAFIIFAVFGMLAVACSSGDEELTLIYTGQTHAMLYPCHCPKDPDGGIARRASLVKELKKSFPRALLLDSGGFFAGGTLDQYSLGGELDQQRSLINLKAMDLMRYDAVVAGVDEFNFGREFLRKAISGSEIAFLSCNIQSEKEFLPYIIKQVGSVKIGIVGVTSPAVMLKEKKLTLFTPKVAVAKAVGELKEKGCDLIILLSTLLENEEFDLIDNVPGIDVVVTYNIGISVEAGMPPEPSGMRGTTLFLRPNWQGRRLGKVSLTVRGKRIVGHKVEELPLSREVTDDPGILGFLPECFSDKDCVKAGFKGQCQKAGSADSRCNFVKHNPVSLLLITTKSCVTCNTEQTVQGIKQWFPGLAVSYLYYPQERAQKLVQDFGIEALPAYLLGKEAEKEEGFLGLRLDKNAQEKGDFYVLSPQLTGLTYLLKREEIKDKLDLFISLYTPEAKEVLDAVRVFNPEVHFLAKEENDGFEAAGGKLEVEEYLRAVCVQKYFPQGFWNYISCRAEKSQSSWWDDCVFSLDVKKIKSCAQGKEGKELLRENTGLNKELGIMFGPTYLLRNKEIFASQGAPSREELKKVIKREER